MVDRAEFTRILASARGPAERVAFFGALLTRDSRLGKRLVVVGGSAISIYTAGAYVSEDVDVVAPRSRVEPTLRRWGFQREGTRERGYWARKDLGLVIDIIDRPDYVGLAEGIRTEPTPYGPVRTAAIEDLVIRRLVFAKRDRRRDLLDQASLLWARFGEVLDRDYTEYLARYEGVRDLYLSMRARAESVAPRSPPSRHRPHDGRPTGVRTARPRGRRTRRKGG